MKNLINKNLTILAIIIFKITLDMVYVNYVVIFYAADLFYLNISISKIIISYILLIVISIFLIKLTLKTEKPSRIVLIIYFMTVIVPLLTLYGYQNNSSIFVGAVSICFITIIVLVLKIPNFNVKILNKSFFVIIILSCVLIYFYVYSFLILTGGISRLNFNIGKVYEYRDDFVNNIGPLMGYFVPWIAYVFNMSILIYGIYKKNKIAILIALFLQMLLFGMTNLKSYLFAPILLVFLYYFSKIKNLFLLTVLSCTALIVSSYVYYIFAQEHLLPSIIIRRQFFVPSNLHLIYYDFFSKENNPFVYLSNSVFSSFVEYPYNLPVTRVISFNYWDRDFGPNVGFMGEAYFQFGILGMFIFSLVLVFILKIIDSFVKYVPSNIISSLIALPAFALTNSALLTTLLTHGFFIALIIVWIFGNLIIKDRNKKIGDG